MKCEGDHVHESDVEALPLTLPDTDSGPPSKSEPDSEFKNQYRASEPVRVNSADFGPDFEISKGQLIHML